ncbi:MAG: NO-inducible flavohemoprotein [Pigmentiphaga sp.]|uniref:NO-inducible flavohemoprotein n=1 Tax=Pigmentiphaga sp. TaxID=1977564 RepID=UPI0029ACCA15|nr:NO-inducible flavohemoprotein [Pigmentiphaga sp.]MDX3907401.1 NO-inducible flavohemoprotein [Pigmentiphaga sp.]
MLSDQHRAIVKATVPLLETGGEALTTHFYRLMLAEHPEVRPLFNQAHQASGAQPRALANGVLAYARHIDDLTPLGGLVGQVVNKHVGLQILPEHYPIVGACLLRAIREVLGPDVATDEVLAAWGAAYQQLASLLIGAEEQCYAAQAKAPGGWRGARAFRVARKEAESAEITSFYLVPADGGALLDFTPGQYIGLKLSIDGTEIRRNYSLSAPPNGREYRISVKRVGDGVASNYLHDHVGAGDTIEVFPPSGNFTLQASDKPLVLISGGVGITPTLAMLDAALRTSRPIHFIHCARNRAVHAFRDYVDAAAAKFPRLKRFYCYDEYDSAAQRPDATGWLTREQLEQWLPRERDIDVYFLGPQPFMRNVRRYLKELNVPEAQSRYEFFGPASAL